MFIAQIESSLLITLDRGFGDSRAHPPDSQTGIVVVRPDDQRVPTVTHMVEALIDNHSIESRPAASKSSSAIRSACGAPSNPTPRADRGAGQFAQRDIGR